MTVEQTTPAAILELEPSMTTLKAADAEQGSFFKTKYFTLIVVASTAGPLLIITVALVVCKLKGKHI
jgi:hypothetical protein